MEQADKWKAKFTELKACVIIPTYNNDQALPGVLADLSRFTANIFVVNDGSTDSTEEILDAHPDIRRISYPVNRGKGWALRKGLKAAQDSGYRHAITIDADGQHFADDLPGFLEKIEQEPPSLIVGSRNMDQAGAPGKSNFGRKFSNFWFRAETGLKCPDTQSGYRSYPLTLLRGMKFYTRKYEFEIEILVRSVWKGIPLNSLPVRVYYAPGGARVTHFRPFRDFFRISLLNSVLFLLAIFYFLPRNFLQAALGKKNWKQTLRIQLLGTRQSKFTKAGSVALGVFMGIIPIWGFQLLVAIFLSIVLKLNKALVILFANISIPPMIPLILYLSYRAGAFWMRGETVSIRLSDHIGLGSIWLHFEQYLYGSITLAIAAGSLSGILAFTVLSILESKKRP
jgi:glycosyltransferase involved in cell wall biosynthesis